jgi:hypothetical protein
MLLVLTGFHAAGKSFFTHNVAAKQGFIACDKKDVIKKIYNSENREIQDYWEWYRVEYNKDPVLMTSKIISELPLDQNVILDSVHSYKEWRIIQSIIPDAVLVLIATPKDTRAERWEEGDPQKDLKRAQYWHSDYNEEKGCLLSEVGWAFNGALPPEVNAICFAELKKYYGLNQESEHNSVLTRKNIRRSQSNE